MGRCIRLIEDEITFCNDERRVLCVRFVGHVREPDELGAGVARTRVEDTD